MDWSRWSSEVPSIGVMAKGPVPQPEDTCVTVSGAKGNDADPWAHTETTSLEAEPGNLHLEGVRFSCISKPLEAGGCARSQVAELGFCPKGHREPAIRGA